mmetsp:Transcript_54105/g.168930  ORF Transcript_54105/g.168930 Transcript_54105/m.168930 type:complete len:271 (-) Transcript_54105:248-1060(-)
MAWPNSPPACRPITGVSSCETPNAPSRRAARRASLPGPGSLRQRAAPRLRRHRCGTAPHPRRQRPPTCSPPPSPQRGAAAPGGARYGRQPRRPLRRRSHWGRSGTPRRPCNHPSRRPSRRSKGSRPRPSARPRGWLWQPLRWPGSCCGSRPSPQPSPRARRATRGRPLAAPSAPTRPLTAGTPPPGPCVGAWPAPGPCQARPLHQPAAVATALHLGLGQRSPLRMRCRPRRRQLPRRPSGQGACPQRHRWPPRLCLRPASRPLHGKLCQI